jgi:hypothetical protein
MMIVYPLVAPTLGMLPAMALISAISARRANPGCAICLFTDPDTKQALQSCSHGLLDVVDEVIVHAVPTSEVLVASRFLKTTLASTIGGPILTLDCDTLVRGDVSSVFRSAGEIAAAPNHSADTWEDQIYVDDLATLDAMAWQPRHDVYLNAGVVFWSGSQASRRLAERWHDLWRESQGRLGIHKDQASFNVLAGEMGGDFRVLPHRFNAQFRMRPQAADGAAIWHYYASDGNKPTTPFERLALRVSASGSAGVRDEVAGLAARPDPWSDGGILDRFVARRLMRNDRSGQAELEWLQGCYRNALVRWGSNVWSALSGRM